MVKVFRNGRILGPSGQLKEGTLIVTGETITGLFPPDHVVSIPVDFEIDLQGKLVFPGLINGHDHLYDTFWPPFGNGPHDSWHSWEEGFKASEWYPRKQALSVTDLYSLGMYRNCVSGVTMAIDHFPREISNTFAGKSLVGLLENFFLSHSASGFAPPWGQGIREEFRQSRGLVPFIIHAGEGRIKEIQEEIDQLNKQGAIAENTVLINCCHVSPADLEIISSRKASIVWCPESCQFTFHAQPPIGKILDLGIPLALGTDSSLRGSINLFETLRAARRYANEALPGRISNLDLVSMVTTSPARIFSLGKTHGAIEAGKIADLLIFEDSRRDPFESFLELTPGAVSLLLHRGRPVYGDESFKHLCAADPSQFSEALLAGHPKIFHGNPLHLLDRIRQKMGTEQEFPFLPLFEE